MFALKNPNDLVFFFSTKQCRPLLKKTLKNFQILRKKKSHTNKSKDILRMEKNMRKNKFFFECSQSVVGTKATSLDGFPLRSSDTL